MTLAYGMRFTSGLPVAAGLCFLLFLFMRALITTDSVPAPPPAHAPVFDIVPKLVDTPPASPRPEPVSKTDPPPPPVIDTGKAVDTAPGPEVVNIALPPLTTGGGVGTETPTFEPPPTPIHRGEQRYPIHLLQRGIEGECVVYFDISSLGTTVNVRAASCSHAGFTSAAEQAVGSWRYSAAGGEERLVRRGESVKLEWRLD